MPGGKSRSSSSRAPRREREDVEETRRAILRTAEQLFMEHGYRAVSTRQIADACGLTQPALYHHFADKRELYLAVMRDDTATARAALERIARRDEPVEARLRQVARYLQARTQHDLGMMLHDIRYELDVAAQRELRELFHTGHIAPLASIFADGIRHGELRAEREGGMDPVTSAFLFLNMLSFYLQAPRGGQGPTAAAASTDRAIHVLLHGLSAGGAREAPATEGEPASEKGDGEICG